MSGLYPARQTPVQSRCLDDALTGFIHGTLPAVSICQRQEATARDKAEYKSPTVTLHTL